MIYFSLSCVPVCEYASVCVWLCVFVLCVYSTLAKILTDFHPAIERLSILFSPHWARQQIIFGKCSRTLEH